jgi:uncharacterized SAM-binding protein YcdF (DUF218 family)
VDVLFLLRKLVSALILPPTGPLLVIVVGLMQMGVRPRLGKGLAWTGVLTLTLLACPPVSGALGRMVAVSEPLDLKRASEAQAIVILSTGLRRDALEYGGDTVSSLTLERIRYGAHLARRTGLPILVSGGMVFAGTPEGQLMQKALEADFGVPVRWTEARSRNTHENAVNSARILLDSGVSRVILVAHAVEMRRAQWEFAQTGIDVIAAPMGFTATLSFDHPFDLLPSASALYGSYRTVYEMVAILAISLGLLGRA